MFKHPWKSNDGFTLIEMLLVLYIVMLTSSIAFHAIAGISEKRVVDQFFQQLVLDIQSAQAIAIEKEQTITIRFLAKKVDAYTAGGEEPIFESEMPENVTFNHLSNLRTILISSNGNVRDFGRLKFYTSFGEVHLIVNIQEGRMRLVEY